VSVVAGMTPSGSRSTVPRPQGAAAIALDSLRARCVMTTFDPMSLAQDPDVLRDIVRRFDGTICLNASVITPGRVAVGDSIALR